ncbi:bifunctional precorrin-2 dehydrogenase/sirohydrochlorin ferrochelatase [Methanothermobacter sp. DP]|uniref:precorrin-2 dehydrogenase/sirohydrochlorin ferrochelatase family protein n=1 Tax=Methanothermobacter sp. DP TaxID=2998972 RepID=UPI002AA52783|nr:bifunctional precorrin-2 dehydrogenase/sirohydrochlorin ferrochelatase [Methanothermobacter sp. DP]
MSLTPLYIDMEGKRVLVVGSGEVGRRRAMRFIEAGAEVAVLGQKVEGAVSIAEEKLGEWIKKADLIVAASPDRSLNERVTELAGGKLLNRADNPSRGNVVVPSTFKIADVSISVFTGKKSPLMAKYLRRRIQEVIKPEDILMIEVQDVSRRMLMEKVPDHRKRRRILYEISEDKMVKEKLEAGDMEGAIRRARDIIMDRGASGDS